MAYLKPGPVGLDMTYPTKSRAKAAPSDAAWPARHAILLWFIVSGLLWLALLVAAVAFS